MNFLAIAAGAANGGGRVFADVTNTGLTINLFWVIVAAVNFIVFLGVIYLIFFKPVSKMLETRKMRIEQGLRDADAARQERESASADRLAAITQARREAEDIISRAQKAADESRERDMAATGEQLEQMRTQAAADIASEKERALAEVRSQVAELALAAASRVVGETMTSEREKRLVNEFLTEVGNS